MKIVYFGTPHFAANVLDHLIKNGIEVVAIVTKPDKPRGRSHTPVCCSVKDLAKKFYPTIPLYQPLKASSAGFVEQLRLLEADLFVVVAYGEILRQNVLELPKKGCINLHASLLPKYRGAAPIQWALLEGAKETGISVIEMGLRMDAGDLLFQEKINLSEETNCAELEEALCFIGKKALVSVLKDFDFFCSQKTAQIEKEATYVQKIHPEMAKIDWRVSASTIHNQVRAFSPRPGAWTFIHLNGALKRFKILKSEIVEQKGTPGTSLSFSKKKWVVACGDQALSLLRVQLEGKKPLSIEAFLLGATRRFDFPPF